jgi:AcrR family transcriptional regulator
MTALAAIPPTRNPRGTTRQRVLKEATALFQDLGYGSTTMRMLATRLGVTPGALYKHYSSKEAILYAYLHEAHEHSLASVKSVTSGDGSPDEKLRAFVRAEIKNSLSRQEAYGASHRIAQLAKFLPSEQQEELQDLQRAWLNILRGVLRAGIAKRTFRRVEVDAVAFAISTLCDYVTIWYRPRRRLNVEAVADIYQDLVLHMLRRCPPKGR